MGDKCACTYVIVGKSAVGIGEKAMRIFWIYPIIAACEEVRKILLEVGIACREKQNIAIIDSVLELVGRRRVGISAIKKAEIRGFAPLVAIHSDGQNGVKAFENIGLYWKILLIGDSRVLVAKAEHERAFAVAAAVTVAEIGAMSLVDRIYIIAQRRVENRIICRGGVVIRRVFVGRAIDKAFIVAKRKRAIFADRLVVADIYVSVAVVAVCFGKLVEQQRRVYIIGVDIGGQLLPLVILVVVAARQVDG